MDDAERRRLNVGMAIFVGTALATGVLVAMAPGSLAYRVTKCAPLLVLCVLRAKSARDRLSRFVGWGLAASLVGDLVIDSVFVAGLGAFLVAHVLYVVGMGAPRRLSSALLPAIPAFAHMGFMVSQLVVAGLAPPDLRVPITAYALVIGTMLGRALGRAFVEPKDHASRLFALGAAIFVASDTLIAVNRWLHPVPFAGVWIMTTYYVGQLLIFRGSVSERGAASDPPA